ncbi:hypothetical protein MPER_00411, partial [Moniliophthora perniciosa FA553]
MHSLPISAPISAPTSASTSASTSTDLQTIRIIDASSTVSETTRVGRVANTSVEESAIRRRMHAAKFICLRPDCGQTFTARHNAINHEYNHLGIRPYRCQYYST